MVLAAENVNRKVIDLMAAMARYQNHHIILETKDSGMTLPLVSIEKLLRDFTKELLNGEKSSSSLVEHVSKLENNVRLLVRMTNVPRLNNYSKKFEKIDNDLKNWGNGHSRLARRKTKDVSDMDADLDDLSRSLSSETTRFPAARLPDTCTRLSNILEAIFGAQGSMDEKKLEKTLEKAKQCTGKFVLELALTTDRRLEESMAPCVRQLILSTSAIGNVAYKHKFVQYHNAFDEFSIRLATWAVDLGVNFAAVAAVSEYINGAFTPDIMQS